MKDLVIGALGNVGYKIFSNIGNLRKVDGVDINLYHKFNDIDVANLEICDILNYEIKEEYDTIYWCVILDYEELWKEQDFVGYLHALNVKCLDIIRSKKYKRFVLFKSEHNNCSSISGSRINIIDVPSLYGFCSSMRTDTTVCNIALSLLINKSYIVTDNPLTRIKFAELDNFIDCVTSNKIPDISTLSLMELVLVIQNLIGDNDSSIRCDPIRFDFGEVKECVTGISKEQFDLLKKFIETLKVHLEHEEAAEELLNECYNQRNIIKRVIDGRKYVRFFNMQ
jgi:hypothetical protein